MTKITFSRSESWKDYRGKRSVTKIRFHKATVGTISGDSGCGIPLMRYTVEYPGIEPFSRYSLKEAKADLLAKLKQKDLE